MENSKKRQAKKGLIKAFFSPLIFSSVFALCLFCGFYNNAQASTLELNSTITGSSTNDYLGTTIAIGDLDDDGYDDLAVAGVSFGQLGEVYIFYNDGSYPTTTASPDEEIAGETTDFFGYALAIADVDNDNDEDLIVGSSGGAGKLYIFNNDGAYPSLAADADVMITGEASSQFGMTISAGDLDNDNDIDLLVAGPNYNSSQGRAYIFYQDATTWGNTSCTTDCLASNADVIIAGYSGSYFGYASMSIGDLDGDNKKDIVIPGPWETGGGKVFIFYQDATTWGTSSCTTGCLASNADVIITGENNSIDAWPEFGVATLIADLDNDTDNDLVITDDGYDPDGGLYEGRAYIFYQDATTWGTASCTTNCLASNADHKITGVGSASGNGMGWRVTSGDFDGDGDTDLAIDEKFYNGAVGQVYLFYQDDSWPSAAADADLIITGESSSQFGQGLMAGDIDGDSDADLVIGAFLYSVGADTYEGRAYIYHQIPSSEPTTTASIGNESPVITASVSDGGSSSTTPTTSDNDVTFSVTAKDINGNQYYLAVCKTDVINAGDDTAPTCDTDQTWAISNVANSTEQATATYTTSGSDANSNTWYAFVCDKVAGGGICFPATASGDQGLALGTVTYSGVPVDGATVTIDSVTYEFDTDNNGVSGGTEVDTSASQVEADAAAVLVAVEAGAGSHMTARSNVVYVYADTAGVAGNSVAMAEAGDTGSAIALSGANLSGGDDDNMSPFNVNLAPTFGTLTVDDGSAGTIEPGDTIYFTLPEAELADDGSINMYICDSSTTGFDYGTNTCTGGSLICSDLAVDAASEDAICNDGGTLAPVPTAHNTYDFYVYVEDNLDVPATGTNAQTYDVEDVAPTLISYTTPNTPSLAAGGSDIISFEAKIQDDNGDDDVTAVAGYFYDDTAIDLASGVCSADENNCYVHSACTLANQDGTDNELDAQCEMTMWFNANASIGWKAHVNPTTDLGLKTDFADSNAVTNIALRGIGVVQSGIAYGSVALGFVSTRQETSVGNYGNQVIDYFVGGDDMCISSYETPCPGEYIPLENQKWYHADEDFRWNATPSAGGSYPWAGPYTLVDTPSGTDDETGCLDRDIQIRNTHDVASTNESIWWKLRIPDTLQLGTYSGQNTFSAADSGTCTSAQSY